MVRREAVSFGPFLFDPATGLLTKHGHRIKLQAKAAALLSRLLDEPGEVVSRVEIQKAMWPDGTNVDFELGIKVAAKKLRDALGDQSDEPTYIQTVYGEGYRFIAAVKPVSIPDLLPPTTPVPEVQEAPPPVTSRRLLWVSALVVVIAALVIQGGASARRVPFQGRDWVLIARFENRTGESLLDGTMEFALARELSRSRYLNVAPPERVRDALVLMRRSPSAELTDDLAREVAVRDGGIRAVLSGRVERFGDKYVLSVRVLSPATGATLAALEREGRQDQLPAAARSISAELRSDLGELALHSPSREDLLERATTTSLPALHAFSSAMRLVNEQKFRPAAELMEEATRQDTQFALAHIYAAHEYSNLGLNEQAAPHYQAAFQLASGVTERERLFILGSYYSRFLHDDRRALGAYEALLHVYPDDFWSVNNSMLAYLRLGMNKEAMLAREQLVALRPNEAGRSRDLQSLIIYYSRVTADPAKVRHYKDELLRWSRAGNVADPEIRSVIQAFLDLDPAAQRWWAGDVKGAAQEVIRVGSLSAAGRDAAYTARIANAYVVMGKLQAAEQLCGRISAPGFRAGCLLRVAYARGDRELAKAQLLRLQDIRPNAYGVSGDTALAVYFGQTDLARKWLDISPDVKNLLALGKGSVESLRRINPPLPGSITGWPVPWYAMSIADALEAKGNSDGAIAVLSDGTRPADVDLAGAWPWPQCRMKLATLLRKHGRAEEAVGVEEEIRHYLSEADPDHPILMRLNK